MSDGPDPEHADPTADGFGDLHAPSYDALFAGRDDPETVGRLLHALADGGEALEFGIGTGRLAIPLARLGTRVHGVDNSREMLRILEGKLGAGDCDVPEGAIVPIRGDFREVRLEAPVSLVFCAFGTLYLMPDQEAQLAVLRNAAANLEVGGRLLVEGFVHDRSRFVNEQEVVAVDVGLETATVRLTLLAPNDQTLTIQKLAVGPRGTSLLPNRLRFVYPAELDLMARLAGLEREARWSGWDRAPFGPKSTNMVVVYRKRAGGPW